MNLPDFLEEHRAAVLARAEKGLHQAHLSHYEQVGSSASLDRLEKLLDLVVECSRTHDLGRMVHHAGQVARERYAGGFALYELQTAFNVLEEAVWVAVTEGLPLEDQVPALGLLGTVLGAGKDALARGYVEMARHHAPHVDPGALLRGL